MKVEGLQPKSLLFSHDIWFRRLDALKPRATLYEYFISHLNSATIMNPAAPAPAPTATSSQFDPSSSPLHPPSVMHNARVLSSLATVRLSSIYRSKLMR
jgi:hypothetical protein